MKRNLLSQDWEILGIVIIELIEEEGKKKKTKTKILDI